MEKEGEDLDLKINFYYVGGSRLPLRAPHIFGVKTKQKLLTNLKLKIMATISVGRNGDIRHSAMSARQIADATNQTTKS